MQGGWDLAFKASSPKSPLNCIQFYKKQINVSQAVFYCAVYCMYHSISKMKCAVSDIKRLMLHCI